MVKTKYTVIEKTNDIFLLVSHDKIGISANSYFIKGKDNMAFRLLKNSELEQGETFYMVEDIKPGSMTTTIKKIDSNDILDLYSDPFFIKMLVRGLSAAANNGIPYDENIVRKIISNYSRKYKLEHIL